jgi:hypothetical protein
MAKARFPAELVNAQQLIAMNAWLWRPLGLCRLQAKTSLHAGLAFDENRHPWRHTGEPDR